MSWQWTAILMSVKACLLQDPMNIQFKGDKKVHNLTVCLIKNNVTKLLRSSSNVGVFKHENFYLILDILLKGSVCNYASVTVHS